MRKRMDIASLGVDGSPTSAEVSRTDGGQSEEGTPYSAAKVEALRWLHATFRQVLATPKDHQMEVERAVSQAAARAGLLPDQARRLRTELLDSILGMGPLEVLLNDPEVTEIMVVGRKVWKEVGGRIVPALPLESSRAAHTLAEDIAAKVGKRFQGARPMLNVAWPDGSRINLVHGMLCPQGACITIRKPDKSQPLEVPDLVAHGMFSQEIADFGVRAVRGRLNVLLSGSTGAGKTTCLRAFANATFDNPTERVFVLEDTQELNLRHDHIVNLVTVDSGDKEKGVDVTMRDLVLNSLRMRPDRIIIGEVRSVEALDLIEAAKSEHGGMLFTMHLRSPEELGSRYYIIAQKAGLGLSEESLYREVYTAVDVVFQLDKLRNGDRRITRVCEPVGTGMRDLFVWDSETDTHRQVADLSDARLALLRNALGGGR